MVHEPGIGKCCNIWRASPIIPAENVTDDDIRMWLDHAEYLFPNEYERSVVLDWLAFIFQNQNVKPRWQIVVHGVVGTGKDGFIQPIIGAFGTDNARNIQSEQVLGRWTDWIEGARLVIVQELQSFGRRETEDRLKPLLTAPPDTISIEKRYMSTYRIPNIAAIVFFTNHESALQISEDDRRYFIVHSPAEKRDEAYYTRYFEWAQDPVNVAKVAGWLAQREVQVNCYGVAPDTEAKREVQAQSMTPLDEWIRDGIANEQGPFRTDLVCLSEVLMQIPLNFQWRQATAARLGARLRAYGARSLGQMRLGKTLETVESDRGVIFSLRRHATYARLSHNEIARLFWIQRERAMSVKDADHDFFSDFGS